MIKQLLSLYNLIEQNKHQFEQHALAADFFIDVYRTQPFEPNLYEFFSLPALFIDYTMTGQGHNKPRLVTLTIHIVVDEMPDASNISQQTNQGLHRFLYCLILQKILEGSRLHQTTALRFINENIIDEPVINYHTQTYEFEAYLQDMIDDTTNILGEFESLNIYGTLTRKIALHP